MRLLELILGLLTKVGVDGAVGAVFSAVQVSETEPTKHDQRIL